MTTTAQIFHLKQTPKGLPDASDFELRDIHLPAPGDNQVLVENLYMSVDPYMRGRMRFMPPGSKLFGAAVGRVLASNSPTVSIGDFVLNPHSWHSHFVDDARVVTQLDPELAPLPSYLGVMGMPGLTAWGGLLITGAYQDGETLFVSAASGAVGSLVGQIAKIKGGRVVGSAGSDDKVQTLISDFGFDHAFNYRTNDPLTELKKGAPDGIDVYFENVGGPQLEAALTHMRPHGRIPICGMIAHYNDHGEATPGPRNLTETIYKFITLKGFVVSAFESKRAEFQQQMAGWIKSGDVRYEETIFEGLASAPEAFIGLFSGENKGKMLVHIAD
jgi:NADPH-dependent curcumin reductase CurA